MKVNELMIQETGIITDDILSEAGEGIVVGTAIIHPDPVATGAMMSYNSVGDNSRS